MIFGAASLVIGALFSIFLDYYLSLIDYVETVEEEELSVSLELLSVSLELAVSVSFLTLILKVMAYFELSESALVNLIDTLTSRSLARVSLAFTGSN